MLGDCCVWSWSIHEYMEDYSWLERKSMPILCSLELIMFAFWFWYGWEPRPPFCNAQKKSPPQVWNLLCTGFPHRWRIAERVATVKTNLKLSSRFCRLTCNNRMNKFVLLALHFGVLPFCIRCSSLLISVLLDIVTTSAIWMVQSKVLRGWLVLESSFYSFKKRAGLISVMRQDSFTWQSVCCFFFLL